MSNAWFGAWHKHRYNAAGARLPVQLLSYFLKLLTDYRAVEAIDGNVKPITFFAFYHELIVKTVMDAAICAGSALGL
ncbi:MAG: hypothetical protein DMF24_08165 [Verrucomicrobia bacterium]|nr:MAG: hypothetical protein DMF24_08165 [Verrucomicrobiota bacterium]